MTDSKKTDKTKEKVEELKKERDEFLSGWQRARADFSNYRKNERERLSEAQKRKKKKIFLDLLEVIDNFELAEKNIDKEDLKNDTVVGLLNVKKQLLDILKSYGVKEMKVEGKEFDPNIHEAVAMIESDDDPDTIAEEVRKGYLIDGELLRPARVKVTKN